MRAGEPLRKEDPDYAQFSEVVARTIRLCVRMNATATELDQVRSQLSAIIGTDIDESTTVFPPFYTNFGQFIRLGKNVFINHNCSFLDIGGITIEDDVQIGPQRQAHVRKSPARPRRSQNSPSPTHSDQTECLDWCRCHHPAGRYCWRKCGGSRRSGRQSGCTPQHGRCRYTGEGGEDSVSEATERRTKRHERFNR